MLRKLSLVALLRPRWVAALAPTSASAWGGAWRLASRMGRAPRRDRRPGLYIGGCCARWSTPWGALAAVNRCY